MLSWRRSFLQYKFLIAFLLQTNEKGFCSHPPPPSVSSTYYFCIWKWWAMLSGRTSLLGRSSLITSLRKLLKANALMLPLIPVFTAYRILITTWLEPVSWRPSLLQYHTLIKKKWFMLSGRPSLLHCAFPFDNALLATIPSSSLHFLSHSESSMYEQRLGSFKAPPG